MPDRIQRSRQAGYRQPPNTKYCGRGTIFGNPYVIVPLPKEARGERRVYRVEMSIEGFHYVSQEFFSKPLAHRHACEKWQEWARVNDQAWWNELYCLAQYEHLSCFCPLEYPCHVDNIIEILDEHERARKAFG